jgi:hypothetical protein
MVIGMNQIKAIKVAKLLLFYRCLYLFSCYWQLNEKKNETDTTPETESRPKTASGDFSEKCQLASEPEPSQTKHSSKINTFLNFNLRQGDYMNPVNFVDPWGLTKIFINIERFRLSSNSIIGRYSIELRELFTDINDFRQNFVAGFRLYQRARQINSNRYYTLEDLWNRNQRNISAIPIGTYEVNTSWSLANQMNLPEFQDVPGNRNYDIHGNFQPIRIHSGNEPADVMGCILLGTTFNPQQNENWISLSRPRVAELMNFINDVRAYDRRRGEDTEIFASITLNLSELFRNFIDRIISGRRDYNILSFLSILSDMANNNAEVLRNLEDFANRFFGPFIPPGHRIIFRTADNWAIERR